MMKLLKTKTIYLLADDSSEPNGIIECVEIEQSGVYDFKLANSSNTIRGYVQDINKVDNDQTKIHVLSEDKQRETFIYTHQIKSIHKY